MKLILEFEKILRNFYKSSTKHFLDIKLSAVEEEKLNIFRPFIYYCYRRIFRLLNTSLYVSKNKKLLDNIFKELYLTNYFETISSLYTLLKRYEQLNHYYFPTQSLLLSTPLQLDLIVKLDNKYKELARILTNQFTSCIKSIKSFLQRLARDQHLLCDSFLNHNQIWVIEDIKPQGDFHNGIQSVYILSWRSNINNNVKKICYKTRNLRADRLFYEIIKYINIHFTTKHYVPSYIYRDKYGWQEYIYYSLCHTVEEIKNFYYRLGSLLAIAKLLKVTDIHHGNVIAYNAFPIIIDFETLCTPELYEDNNDKFLIIHTGILPKIRKDKGSNRYTDVSVVSGKRQYIIDETIRSINLFEQNRPMIVTGQDIEPLDYLNYFRIGYDDTYQVIKDNQPFILNILNKNKNFVIRLVIRNTNFYNHLISNSLALELLRNTRIRNNFVEQYLTHSVTNIQELCSSEITALLECSVPYFSLYSQSKFIINNVVYSNILAKKPFKSLISNLYNNFNKDDLLLDHYLISLSFLVSYLNSNHKELLQANFIPRKNNKNHIREIILYSSKIFLKTLRQFNLISLNYNQIASLCLLNISIKGGLLGWLLLFIQSYKSFNCLESFKIFKLGLEHIKSDLEIKDFNWEETIDLIIFFYLIDVNYNVSSISVLKLLINKVLNHCNPQNIHTLQFLKIIYIIDRLKLYSEIDQHFVQNLLAEYYVINNSCLDIIHLKQFQKKILTIEEMSFMCKAHFWHKPKVFNHNLITFSPFFANYQKIRSIIDSSNQIHYLPYIILNIPEIMLMQLALNAENTTDFFLI